MPALDFPPNTAHPAVPVMGDKWPQPPVPNQPVYTWDGVKWTTHGEAVDDVIGASNLIPLPDGVASAGVEANWSRGDHVHPALINDLVLTGNPTAPTPPLGDNDTTIATTAFVQSTVTATEIGTSVLVGSNAPVGAADNSLWFEDDTGRLYIFYNDGTGPSQWIAAAPVPDAITSRYGIYAAPFDAMAYSGMQVNGGMEVSQELGTGGRGTTGYVCDGLVWTNSTTAAIFVSATLSSLNPGFQGFVSAPVGTAQATVTTTQAATFYQPIEGWRISRLAWGSANAQPITISFWTCHARTGTYSVAVRNGDDTRSFVTTYMQNVASTWEYKTVTVVGCTDGTWNKSNGAGMRVQFAMACGPTFTAPTANTWSNALYIAAPGQINGVAATSDTFRLTGVTVLPGTQYPEADQSALVMRPYDQELVTCERYYMKRVAQYNGQVTNAVAYAASVEMPRMRANPTITSVDNFLQSFPANAPGPGFVPPDFAYDVRPATATSALGILRVVITGDARL